MYWRYPLSIAMVLGVSSCMVVVPQETESMEAGTYPLELTVKVEDRGDDADVIVADPPAGDGRPENRPSTPTIDDCAVMSVPSLAATPEMVDLSEDDIEGPREIENALVGYIHDLRGFIASERRRLRETLSVDDPCTVFE